MVIGHRNHKLDCLADLAMTVLDVVVGALVLCVHFVGQRLLLTSKLQSMSAQLCERVFDGLKPANHQSAAEQ